MPTTVEVVIDQPALAAFKSWTGPLGHSITRLAKEMTYRQKILANKETGALAASITWHKVSYSRGIAFHAGSPLSYALYVESGTKPHPIAPKKAGGMLIFYWAKVGHVVHLKSVKHPGTKAYRFLERGAERALRVWDRAG